MSVYAISDLHLSFGASKPMDVFGAEWIGYTEKIETEWRALVGVDDTVLLPGDISWAMYIDEALPDFKFLESLPGEKIISKGNHDYWWTTMRKMKEFLEGNDLNSISFLYNDSIVVEESIGITAARGWVLPGSPDFGEQDEKLYNREKIRLELSFKALKRYSDVSKVILMLHYPPLYVDNQISGFTDIIDEHKPEVCIYGHLHGRHVENAFEGKRRGTEYRLVSSDCLKFKPLLLSG
ncbi:MAG: metallophosphoesterase [Oscillospiraceae bacterium]|nr:metallophosphoesterase [Oscillospiraceae bacterium]